MIHDSLISFLLEFFELFLQSSFCFQQFAYFLLH